MMARNRRSAGGIVIPSLKERDKCYIRLPAGDQDVWGSWTFPNGGVDPHESDEQAALREVKEEIGVTARILAPIPGEFLGTTTINKYFLMVQIGAMTSYDDETAEARLVTIDEAMELVSWNQRDVNVLNAAIKVLDTLK
jgi:8-oxo-dGTP pyrophosphatase MutT (NUDIX family)